MGYHDPRRASQDELVEELAAEIDGTQIDACLALTPTERLERLRKLVELFESAKEAGGDRSATAD